MDSPQSMGTNRTGIDMSPEGAEQMTEATREYPPTSSGSQVDLAQLRMPYFTEADPIGTMPVPGTVKGMAKPTRKKSSAATRSLD